MPDASTQTEPDASTQTQPDTVQTCPLCLDVPVNPITTTCGHVFCSGRDGQACQGLRRLFGHTRQLIPCPICRENISYDLISAFPITEFDSYGIANEPDELHPHARLHSYNWLEAKCAVASALCHNHESRDGQISYDGQFTEPQLIYCGIGLPPFTIDDISVPGVFAKMDAMLREHGSDPCKPRMFASVKPSAQNTWEVWFDS